MATTPITLTANSSIEAWLGHPEGGPLLRGFLAQAGMDETALAPAIKLPLGSLVAMSGGQLPQEVVDDLVLRANGGVMPDASADSGAWQERIVPGRFSGRTLIITGAASGIGRATASRIAREGGRVIAVDLAAEALQAFATSIGEAVVPVVANITKPEDVARVVEAAGPSIDGLANIAGIADDFSPLHEVTDAAWERIFAVNVDGLFRLTRAVLPAMLEAGSGSIVNIASEAALRGNAAGLAYTASKHAVVGITRSAAFMYGRNGIRVNAVAPGGVATGIQTGTPSEFGGGRVNPFLALIPPVALPEHLAASIAFLLSDDGINLNGVILPSDGGWSVQ
jgi:NAD(P)-dependent dehydrogenase (short-subunit alcohol dehydrogenase family)